MARTDTATGDPTRVRLGDTVIRFCPSRERYRTFDQVVVEDGRGKLFLTTGGLMEHINALVALHNHIEQMVYSERARAVGGNAEEE